MIRALAVGWAGVSSVDLFVYGTLMVPRVMEAVCGYAQPGVAAVLPNHRCRLVNGEVYPAIVPKQGEQVNGLVYRNLSDQELEQLDRFEGDMYRRGRVDIVIDRQTTTAQTYLLAAAFRQLLSDTPWDLEHFMVDGIQYFIAGYDGFSRATVGANPDD